MPDSLDQLFDLYRATFPANERRAESALRSAVATAEYRVLTEEDAGDLVGFALLFMPREDDFSLLEYLAVHPASRGRGIGTQLVQSAIEESRGRSLITEIESQFNNSDAQRRQIFYKRCGFNPIVGLKYQLPLGRNPPPMELWVQPDADSVQPPQLAHWLTKIYTDVYHCSNDDPRIKQMLQFCA